MKNPAAVALGKLGGSKGGQKRAENLSPEQRSEIAQRAAQARWAKAKKVMPVEADTSTGGGSAGHDLIEGLIKKLPPESSAWATRDRYKWLQAANTIFDLIYENVEDGGSLRIEIEDSASRKGSN